MKRSVILTDCLGPDILSAFWTKGQVLHREREHLKVPGFSIVLNVLLTRKLPTFLSRLNEISGGCEKIGLRMLVKSHCLRKPGRVKRWG